MLDCEVVRDLLPLYTEQMVSPHTAELVGEHLQNCPACDEIHRNMTAPAPEIQFNTDSAQQFAAYEKKQKRKAGRKAKEAAEMVEKTIKKATLNIIIESPMGGSISTDEIAAKVPNGASAVYVRVDENKLYWVKGKETGSVDIWA